MFCSICREDKPADAFYKNASRSTGVQSYCRTCHRAKRDASLAVTMAYVKSYKESHPCVDCGEPDPLVLDFDHVRGEKRTDVASLVVMGASLASIQTEIAKCDVRCANCHRRVTWYRKHEDMQHLALYGSVV